MKIVIAGGAGQVGTILARAFHAGGHEVTVLTRASALHRPWPCLVWDGRNLGPWAAVLEGTDVVINLCGRNVNCRYTAANRCSILESRVVSTQLLARAIAQASTPPRIWLQASMATLYAHRYDAPNDEINGLIGGEETNAPDTWRFSIDVATQWERAAQASPLPRTRLVLLRSAMTMSPDSDGVFDVLLRLVRVGLGGAAGDGRQFVSWIHEADFVAAILWLIDQEQMEGPVNLCSPNPLPNRAFMAELRAAWGAPIGLSSPACLLEIGAAFLRTETELILKSRRVVPTRLLQGGFRFQFPDWRAAADDLCRRWREA